MQKMPLNEPLGTRIYKSEVIWNGNRGGGTADATTYTTDHTIMIPGKAALQGAADEAGRRPLWHSPEDLLIASVLASHMVFYLHLCSKAGVVVTDYRDRAAATLVNDVLVQILLGPRAKITADSDAALARRLHAKAHQQNNIAKAVTFSIRLRPVIIQE